MGRVAVLDIGTVTCRLGVADVAAGRVVRLAKSSTICNLGEGVSETGNLSQEACDRVLNCIEHQLEQARAAQATCVCCTLTSAARDAANAKELLTGLRTRGVVPQVIPGEIEGTLTFLGVAQDFPNQRIMVADNGGGSTEIAVGLFDTSIQLEAVQSLDVGCRRVTDLFLSHEDPPSAQACKDAREFCRKAFQAHLPLVARFDQRPDTLVCVGGTVTTLVAIAAHLDPYDPAFVHLHPLELTEIDELADQVLSVPLAQRKQTVGLQAQRAGVIGAGAICVSELVRACGLERLMVSESDLLFGLALVTDATAHSTASPIGWHPELALLH